MKKFNKKGFTLVELIVVIAIIGVLAAILVPTMMGYVHDSQVTSADRVAADISRNIDYFMTEADTAGYGMKKAAGLHTDVKIVVTAYEWEITVTDPTVFAGNGYQWTGVPTAVKADTANAAITNADGIFAQRLASLFPEIEDAYIGFLISEGTCGALYITTDGNTPVTILPFDNDGWSDDVFIWNGENEGITDEGSLVGTAPKLKLGQNAQPQQPNS